MGSGKKNFGNQTHAVPTILQDPETLERVAAKGSFIFVKGGSLYEEYRRRGVEVRAE